MLFILLGFNVLAHLLLDACEQFDGKLKPWNGRAYKLLGQNRPLKPSYR
jgi:hypothetical protein